MPSAVPRPVMEVLVDGRICVRVAAQAMLTELECWLTFAVAGYNGSIHGAAVRPGTAPVAGTSSPRAGASAAVFS